MEASYSKGNSINKESYDDTLKDENEEEEYSTFQIRLVTYTEESEEDSNTSEGESEKENYTSGNKRFNEDSKPQHYMLTSSPAMEATTQTKDSKFESKPSSTLEIMRI